MDMARVGKSPTRELNVSYKPADVTLIVVTHIPHLLGYYKDRMEIVKACLASMTINADLPYQLAVFDNASCPEFRDYLLQMLDMGMIDFLELCKENVGKARGMEWLWNQAPSNIVAWSDDDILFYPQWLSHQVQILQDWPRVGVVTGYPTRTAFKWAIDTNLAWSQEDPDAFLKWEDRIPDQWEVEYAVSVAKDLNRHFREIVRQDPILVYKGQEAFATGHHCQFVAYKERIQPLLRWLMSDHDKAMGDMIKFDVAIDRAGYLRLATIDRYTRHMGNIIDPDLQIEIGKYANMETKVSYLPKRPRCWKLFQKGAILHNLGKKIYEGLYFRLA